jgi:hypothetical protein
MSKSKGVWNGLTMGIACVLLGLIALGLTPVFNLFFVPIIVFIVWRNLNRVKLLEDRVAKMESGQSGH